MTEPPTMIEADVCGAANRSAMTGHVHGAGRQLAMSSGSAISGAHHRTGASLTTANSGPASGG
jgi:hypothetical protein